MTDAQASSGTYRMLRQLGARGDSTYAAIRGAHELVVVQRFSRSSSAGEVILREAQYVEKNWHPNVARVRYVDLIGDEILVATEFIDGVTLQELLILAESKRTESAAPSLPPPLFLRIMLDILGGLQSIHGMRDPRGASLPSVHGAICPTNIVVGKDGVARLVAPFRPRPLKLVSSSEALCYSAPEVLAAAEPNPRSDLYSCGLLLWEGLQGKRLFVESEASQLLHRQRTEKVPWSAPPASVIAQLGVMVLRTLALEPGMRFKSPTELGTAIRKVAGPQIATGSAVAKLVVELAGERIRARRAELEQRGSAREVVAKPSLEAPAVTVKELSTTEPPAVTVRRPPIDDAPAVTVRKPGIAGPPPSTRAEAPPSSPDSEPTLVAAPKADPNLEPMPTPVQAPVARTAPIAQARPAPATPAKPEPRVQLRPPIVSPPAKKTENVAVVRPPIALPTKAAATAARPPVAKTEPLVQARPPPPKADRTPKAPPTMESPAQAPPRALKAEPPRSRTPPEPLAPLLVTSAMVTSSPATSKPLLANVTPAPQATVPPTALPVAPPPAPALAPTPSPPPPLAQTLASPQVTPEAAVVAPVMLDPIYRREKHPPIAAAPIEHVVPVAREGVSARTALIVIAATFAVTLVLIVIVVVTRPAPSPVANGKSKPAVTMSAGETPPETPVSAPAKPAETAAAVSSTAAASAPTTDPPADPAAPATEPAAPSGVAPDPAVSAPANSAPDPAVAAPPPPVAPRPKKVPYEPLGI